MIELKVEQWLDYGGEPRECYPRAEVDAAIAELKQTLQDKLLEAMKYKAENIELLAWKRLHENCDNYIDTLEKKLEDAKATAYAESVDVGMRERRLRRLLWHAIALFCARSCEYFNGIMSHCLMGQDDLYRRCEEKKNKYLHAMYKCRAKAEEYK